MVFKFAYIYKTFFRKSSNRYFSKLKGFIFTIGVNRLIKNVIHMLYMFFVAVT